MVYGIVSQVDNATTRAYFKNKRVPDVNVVYITQLASLVQMLKSGDVVFVVSVNRFASVSQFSGLESSVCQMGYPYICWLSLILI